MVDQRLRIGLEPAGPDGITAEVGDELTLPEAADILGVHYMTAYRYVRIGKLPAVKDGGSYRVRRADLEALRSIGRRRGVTGDEARRFEERVLGGDEPGAWRIIEDALALRDDPAGAHLDVIVPALYSLGNRWEQGSISVGDEHLATGITARIVARLGPRFRRRGTQRARVLLGAVEGDAHGLATHIMADILRGARFDVADLGPSPPASAWAAMAASQRFDVIGINAAVMGNLDTVAETVAAVRNVTDRPILLGGRGVGSAIVAAELGADGWALDPVQALRLFERSVGPSSRSGLR